MESVRIFSCGDETIFFFFLSHPLRRQGRQQTHINTRRTDFIAPIALKAVYLFLWVSLSKFLRFLSISQVPLGTCLWSRDNCTVECLMGKLVTMVQCMHGLRKKSVRISETWYRKPKSLICHMKLTLGQEPGTPPVLGQLLRGANKMETSVMILG